MLKRNVAALIKYVNAKWDKDQGGTFQEECGEI